MGLLRLVVVVVVVVVVEVVIVVEVAALVVDVGTGDVCVDSVCCAVVEATVVPLELNF